MAWNEPGDNDKPNNKPDGQDSGQNNGDSKQKPDPNKRPDNPWAAANRGSNRGSNGQRRGSNNNQQPPDLEEALKELKARLASLFGLASGGKSGNKKTGSNNASGGYGGLIVLLLITAVAWFVYDSLYVIDAQEQGVVLRFGEAREELLEPGLNLRWPRPIERVFVVNTQAKDERSYESEIITKDLSLVHVKLDIQYRKADPVAYLFNTASPEETMEKAISAAIRKIIGEVGLQDALSNKASSAAQKTANEIVGREAVNNAFQSELQTIMDDYNTGIVLVEVLIGELLPPEKIRDSFEGITEATQESKRVINEAKKTQNTLETEAEGTAKGILSEANRDAETLKKRAKGEATRFDKLYQQYRLAPKVTRDRLYLEVMEKVLASSSKIILDGGEGSNNMTVLPLDQLIKSRVQQKEESAASTSAESTNNQQTK